MHFATFEKVDGGEYVAVGAVVVEVGVCILWVGG